MNRSVKSWHGFTIVELIVVIAVIAILASVSIASYGPWRRHNADAAVQSDLSQGTSSLRSYKNFQNSYPPNLAGTNFSSSANVALVLYTNAPTIGVYSNLTDDQNAQLLLNVCNANLNDLYNTVCTFGGAGGGAKIHVAGTNTTNTIWESPISQSDVTLPCGTACDNATNTMISQFLAQGGQFPILVSGNTAALPQPTQTPNGLATSFCLEGHSGIFPDIIYHTSDSKTNVASGVCPYDPTLHYFPPS